MASFVSTNAHASIGGVDLSAHCVRAELVYEGEVQDDTAHGDSTRSNVGGLLSWTMDFEFLQNYATGGVDPTIYSLVNTTTTCAVRASATAVGATNPTFTGLGLISNYQPMAGSVGEMAKASVSVLSAGDLSRATS